MVGRVRDPVDEPWWDACARFLSRPNVHALGWRPQEALAGYYQAFDVSLIPYRIDHPFNRACNPTKIMDAMGSGRPIVATAIPECRLHAERFHVAENGDEFVAAVRQILDQQSDDGRAGLRHAYALANTCHGIGERILDLIEHGRRRSRPDRAPIRARCSQNVDGLTHLPAETDGNSRRQAVESFAFRPGGGVSARAPAVDSIPDNLDPRAPTMNPAIRIKLSVMMFLEYVIYGAWLPLLSLYLGKIPQFQRRREGLDLQRLRHRVARPAWSSADSSPTAISHRTKFLAFSHLIGGLAMLGLIYTKTFWPFLR